MRRILLALAAALLFTGVMASTAGAAPSTPPNDNFGGSVNSTDHRSDDSGKGNFGQCHHLGGVQGAQSADFNPSASNSGAADCRFAGDLAASAGANCDPGSEAAAEVQLTFHPKGASASASCS